MAVSTRDQRADSGLGEQARRVVEWRYAQHDGESWAGVSRRVAGHVAAAERDPRWERAFEAVLFAREFMPNTPCLIGAGRSGAQLASCFVLPVVADSVAGVMETATAAALVAASGGGTGFAFDPLRPYGAPVASGGRASGPVEHMRIVDTTIDVIRRGGLGRGACMGMLEVAHPDVLRFVHAKDDLRALTNFNVSVKLTDDFLAAVDRGDWIETRFAGRPWTRPVLDPETGGEYGFGGPPPRPGMVFAPDVWRRLVESAHRTGEPGVAFIDEVNRGNRLAASMGPIVSSNPCGEQFLHDWNACNLGSIDLSRFHHPGTRLDWERLARVVHLGVRFLDDVIDACAWPLPEIADVVGRTRPVGLGIMGFADLCLKLGLRYGSPESCRLMEEVAGFVRREGWRESLRLGAEKGVFAELEPNTDAYADLVYGELGLPADTPLTPRTYQVTMAEPAATVAMVAETSSGIEPNFSWAMVRNDQVGARTHVHPLAARALGIELDPLDRDSIERAAEQVLAREHELPDHFVTAHSIGWAEHLEILAAAQRHVDNSVSKTCNGHRDDTPASADALFRQAGRLGCKAVSYYRDGSRADQVLQTLAPVDACAVC